MDDAQPSTFRMNAAELQVNYRNGTARVYTIPIVDEYEDDDQQETSEVYTLDDLYSEIATAFQLGAEGSLHIPVQKVIDAGGSRRNGFIWINTSAVEELLVLPLNA